MTLRLAVKSFGLIEKMVEIGNPNSVTDAGVGALCARAAAQGAFLNIKVNSAGLTDQEFAQKVVAEGESLVKLADELEAKVLGMVHSKI